MGAAFFYHMTRTPLEQTLPALVTRALAAGWRVQLRAAPDRLVWLDELLWQGPPESFLAHGIAGGPHDADQPVLLSAQAAMPSGAQCLMAIEGAAVDPEEVRRLERVCILFDGADPQALETARAQWRALTRAGCAAQYWSQQEGGWTKAAEA